MAKLVLVVLVIAAVVGGSYFFLNYEVQRSQARRLEDRPAQGRGGRRRTAADDPQVPPAADAAHRLVPARPIRRGQAGQPAGERRALGLLPQFDLVAVQGVRGKNQGVLIRLIEQINATTGRTYDFATVPDAAARRAGALQRVRVRPRHGSTSIRQTVRFCRGSAGPLPHQAAGRPVLRAWAGPGRGVHLHAHQRRSRSRPGRRRVGSAGRCVSRRARQHPNEDDIILLGDLESDDQHLGELGKLLGVTPLISGVATTTRGTNCWTTSCWTAARPASSSAASRSWT